MLAKYSYIIPKALMKAELNNFSMSVKLARLAGVPSIRARVL